MANIKSAKKAMRSSARKSIINERVHSELKSLLKKSNNQIMQKAKDVIEQVKITQKALDKAAASGKIHKNKAARLKSRLMRKMNKK